MLSCGLPGLLDNKGHVLSSIPRRAPAAHLRTPETTKERKTKTEHKAGLHLLAHQAAAIVNQALAFLQQLFLLPAGYVLREIRQRFRLPAQLRTSRAAVLRLHLTLRPAPVLRVAPHVLQLQQCQLLLHGS